MADTVGIAVGRSTPSDRGLNSLAGVSASPDNEFAFADPTRRGEFRYGVISKNLEDRFGAPWRILPVDGCEEVIAYLQQRISRTRQARINKGKGWKAYSTFEEFLKKYGE